MGSGRREAICPKCKEASTVLDVIADKIEREGCGGCWNRPMPSAAAPTPASSFGPSRDVEKQEVPAAAAAVKHPGQFANVPKSAGGAPATNHQEEATMETTTDHTKDQLRELLVAHTPLPKAAKEAGVTQERARAVRDELIAEGVKCSCTRKLAHRGGCRGVAQGGAKKKAAAKRKKALREELNKARETARATKARPSAPAKPAAAPTPDEVAPAAGYGGFREALVREKETLEAGIRAAQDRIEAIDVAVEALDALYDPDGVKVAA